MLQRSRPRAGLLPVLKLHGTVSFISARIFNFCKGTTSHSFPVVNPHIDPTAYKQTTGIVGSLWNIFTLRNFALWLLGPAVLSRRLRKTTPLVTTTKQRKKSFFLFQYEMNGNQFVRTRTIHAVNNMWNTKTIRILHDCRRPIIV